MKINPTPIRGMKDYLPLETEKRDAVTAIIVDTYKGSGFSRIETPALENLNFLTGGDGGENEKLIYKIMKRGKKLKLDNILNENDIAEAGLRFDLTVPLSRFYANNFSTLSLPFKSIQIGPVWRAERPQKGRYRQFVQCDIDIIGEKTILAEIDILLAGTTALLNLGFENFKVIVNDRRILQKFAEISGFVESEFGDVFISADKIDKIGFEGMEKELIAKNYSKDKVEKFSSIISSFTGKDLLKTIQELNIDIDADIVNDLQKLMDILKSQSEGRFEVCYEPSLIRGMGYYTGPVFEITYKDYSGSIGGGGRYNNMLGKKFNREISACGFSIGFERILDIMNEENRNIKKAKQKIAFLFDMKNDEIKNVYEVSQKLQQDNPESIVSVLKKEKKLGKQLKNLKEVGFSNYFIFGENELKAMK